MENKYIVLVGDIESGTWSVAINSSDKEIADEFYEDMRLSGDMTPAIKIYTGDFVTV